MCLLQEPNALTLFMTPPCPHRRRPLRPPFRLVESEGVGVTSSILPIFIPERARARSADWAPGPGVLVPFPVNRVSAEHKFLHSKET